MFPFTCSHIGTAYSIWILWRNNDNATTAIRPAHVHNSPAVCPKGSKWTHRIRDWCLLKRLHAKISILIPWPAVRVSSFYLFWLFDIKLCFWKFHLTCERHGWSAAGWLVLMTSFCIGAFMLSSIYDCLFFLGNLYETL